VGWYEGFRLLVAINPAGVITGFGFCPASTKDQPLAETFFALRAEPSERLPSTGSAALDFPVETGLCFHDKGTRPRLRLSPERTVGAITKNQEQVVQGGTIRSASGLDNYSEASGGIAGASRGELTKQGWR
jgi:hypothetical protein